MTGVRKAEHMLRSARAMPYFLVRQEAVALEDVEMTPHSGRGKIQLA